MRLLRALARIGWVRAPYAAQYETLLRGGFVMMPLEESALTTLCRWQRVALALGGAVVLLALVRWPLTTLTTLNAAALAAYFAVVSFRFYTVHRGERALGRGGTPSTERPTSMRTGAAVEEAALPVYTILCPLYREAELVEQFVRGMQRLDYPFEKLDIRLLLEEDDHETRAAAQAVKERPRTKPKACNYGLREARGEYVVIYDAEDIPEPDQLKRVLAAFRHLPPDTVCVQAKLNYFNPRQNLLTRFFTAEYSVWFDLLLPGLASVGSPIPLGGTSNHFKLSRLRELCAWDPFNVTEDADLGIRIACRGYRTAIIDSTTWEEANSRVGNWIRQRSRWVKGYMQVWLVMMRHPLRLLRALGPWRFFCFHAIVGGTPFVLLFNPIYWTLTLVYVLSAWSVVPRLFPEPVLVVSLLTGLIGNLTFIYLSIYGLLKREHYDIVPLMFLSPLYWVLQSIAAWKALYQLLVKPHFWEKTMHNLATPMAGGLRP